MINKQIHFVRFVVNVYFLVIRSSNLRLTDVNLKILFFKTKQVRNLSSAEEPPFGTTWIGLPGVPK